MKNYTAIYSTEVLKNINYSFNAENIIEARKFCVDKFTVPVDTIIEHNEDFDKEYSGVQKVAPSLKSRLMSIAHAVKSQFASFSEALKHAWRVIRMYKAMKSKDVSFSFKKVDGSLRLANGTLRADALPESKGSDRPTNFGLFVYFDLDANAWRSAKVENLIF